MNSKNNNRLSKDGMSSSEQQILRLSSDSFSKKENSVPILRGSVNLAIEMAVAVDAYGGGKVEQSQ